MTLEPRDGPGPQDDEYTSITGSCAFVLSIPVLMITFMILIGEFIGFRGVGGVVISLIVTGIAALFGALIIGGIASAIMGGPHSPPEVTSGPPHPPAVHSPGPATKDPKSQVETPPSRRPTPPKAPSLKPTPPPPKPTPRGWRPHLRRHEPDVDRELRNVELMVRERPEFTGLQQEKILDAVARFSDHHRQQQHILENASHPDHAMVVREMDRYRRTVVKLLQIRQDELAAGSYGGFDYRGDLREIEGMVELLQDEFEQLRQDPDHP